MGTRTLTRNLRDLIQCLPQDDIEISGETDRLVTGITNDSRKVEPGYIFAGVRGLKRDGHDFIGDAIRRGAIAIVAERNEPLPPGVPLIRVRHSREAVALLSAAFWDNPSWRLRLIGVTGTNGKTTTVHLISLLLESAGRPTGVSTTLYSRAGGEVIPQERTTPDSPELQRLLARFVEGGARYAVIEVSSHAIALSRVYGCAFDVAVLTNISRDHFDFHGSYEAYRAVKAKLFTSLPGNFPGTPA
ncbi:MAG TPA: UDP-N-acetylmuramoyl-L-alanyl-D-glutamate--2,6-diaminopimelate ligase, partial [Firmicutes bacterium]|nr:UDP-N-acetylmuramoyl-L-alanyl-D-glutamate--2,6-diaminopimelate ligase [Bacillota bacterium]